MKPSLAVQCPTCLSNPGEECAALAANGVSRLGYISTSHSARQVAALDASEAAEKAERAKSNAQVVDTIDEKPVTRGELSAAFARVQDAKHWKNPIDAVVTVSSSFELAVIERAVVFFTGSVPESELRSASEGGRATYRVRAEGYYAAIGA